MATTLTAWSPEILPDIIGVPIPALKVAVRNAAIEFCEETFLWTYTLDRISIVASTRTYTLTVPVAQYGELIGIDDAKYKQNGQDDDQFVTLDPISENQMDLHESGSWSFHTASTPSKYWCDVVNKQIHLKSIPTEASVEGLLVRVILRPTVDCDTVPDFLYKDHRKAIAHGALSGLFSKKGMPWYDPNEAISHGGKFINAYDSAKSKKITGATKRPLRVKMREFI